MTYIERQPGESLAMHLHRNAELLGMDDRQRRVLREAARLSHPGRTAKERADAGRMAEAIRNELKAAMDQVIYAAQARGERIVPFNDQGAVRIVDRDGLLTVVANEALYNTGMMYRGLYEMVGFADVGSQLGRMDGQPGAARASTDGLHTGRLTKVYASVQLAHAEQEVAQISAAALTVLRSVAGEGQSLTSRGMSGYERRRRGELLRQALEAARLSFAETGGLRIRGT